MTSKQSRIAVKVDVFDKTEQHALALPALTPPEFIAGVLEEFRELEYLSDIPSDYYLINDVDQTMFDDNLPISRQLSEQDRIILLERELPLPADTKRPSHNIYLREQQTGKVFKLHWLPAIIGRPDDNLPNNDWLIANLEAHKGGLRVSRRHVKIGEEDGQYYVESLSPNPTTIMTNTGAVIPLTSQKQPLCDGDVIYLERSDISLKFIVREHGLSAENFARQE